MQSKASRSWSTATATSCGIFNYVDDVVEALLLAAAEAGANGHVYNLGTRKSSTSAIAQIPSNFDPARISRSCRFLPSAKSSISGYYGNYDKIRPSWVAAQGCPAARTGGGAWPTTAIICKNIW